jgi:hypothetical protein
MALEAKRAVFTHLREEALEKYALGRLPKGELASFEKHLLHCEHCQERLAAEDNLVEARRVMAGLDDARIDYLSPVLAPSRRSLWAWMSPFISGWGIPAWGAALIVAVVLIAGIGAWKLPFAHNSPTQVEAVILTTLRGGSAGGVAQAHAGRPLELSIDVATLPGAFSETGPYRLEMVDATGDQVWTAMVSPSAAGQMEALMEKRLSMGTYWVRLYARSGKLLREFGLHVD